MTWSEAKSLDESLSSLDSFFNSSPQIAEILAGGLTNRCWKITCNVGIPYVWRPISAQLFQFGISRVREYQLLDSLAKYHFSPVPIHLNNQGLLVEWLEESEETIPFSDRELINTLCNIHSVNTHNKPISLFSFTAKVDSYWHRLHPRLKTKPCEAIYSQYRELPYIPPVDATLCHFDFGDYNMVRTDQGIKVIDWEYAGVGDPRMDLAMTLDLAELDFTQSVAEYCHIRGLQDTDNWLLGVNQWKPRNQMMSMLWYLLGYQLWNDEHYLQQAKCLEVLL